MLWLRHRDSTYSEYSCLTRIEIFVPRVHYNTRVRSMNRQILHRFLSAMLVMDDQNRSKSVSYWHLWQKYFSISAMIGNFRDLLVQCIEVSNGSNKY